MARPVDAKWPTSQRFGGLATRGVVGRFGGSEVEYLVALYGDYQPFGHAGLDIACPIGTPVYAIMAGTVVWAGWGEDLPGDESWGPNGYFRRWGLYKTFPGIVTVIKHGNVYSVYGHLSSNDAAPVGTVVREGQLIGYSGNTKTRTEYVGAHLHVAVVADPISYSTGNGLIFGCADPEPYFGGLSYASESITPLEEDMPLTKEDVEWIVGRVTEEAQKIADVDRKHLPAATADAVLTKQVPHKDPITGKDDGTTTSLATMAGFFDFQAVQTRLAKASPQEIASVIPSEVAAEVARLLSERLAK